MTPLIAIPIGITVATATWIVISWWDKRRRDREQSGNFPKATRVKREHRVSQALRGIYPFTDR